MHNIQKYTIEYLQCTYLHVLHVYSLCLDAKLSTWNKCSNYGIYVDFSPKVVIPNITLTILRWQSETKSLHFLASAMRKAFSICLSFFTYVLKGMFYKMTMNLECYTDINKLKLQH